MTFLPAIAVAVLLALPRPAQANTPFSGRWAEDPAWCHKARKDGIDALPITFTRRSIETFATFCQVLAAVRTARTVWRLRASCRGEAQSELAPRTRVTVVLRLSGDRLSLHKGAGERTLVRCPD